MAVGSSTINPKLHATGDVGDDELISNFTAAKTEIEANGLTTIVTITSAQLLALNATPVSLLAAPTAGYAYIIDKVVAYKPAGTAYAGVATGEDLAIRYTNGSGTIMATVETTGFLDQATAQTRAINAVITDITPINAAVVAHMTTGEITTGTSDLKLRLTYRLVPLTF